MRRATTPGRGGNGDVAYEGGTSANRQGVAVGNCKERCRDDDATHSMGNVACESPLPGRGLAADRCPVQVDIIPVARLWAVCQRWRGKRVCVRRGPCPRFASWPAAGDRPALRLSRSTHRRS